MQRIYKSGIYQILNTVNNKRYIGSSVSIKRRWVDHLSALNNNRNSDHLQSAWNKYSKDVFRFEVLCYCSRSILLQKEQEYIDFHQTTNPKLGYNLCPTAGNCLGIKHSEEFKEKRRGSNNVSKREDVRLKIALSNKGRIVSVETRLKSSKITKEHHEKYGHPCLGKHCSEETKKKLSIAAKLRPISRGWKLSEETKLKMGLNRKGKPKNLSLEQRKVLSDRMKKNVLSEDAKRSISEKATKRHEKNREEKKKQPIIKKYIRVPFSEERKKKYKEIMNKKWEEHRAYVSFIMSQIPS